MKPKMFTQQFPVIRVAIKQEENTLYDYTYTVTTPDGKLYPLGMLTDNTPEVLLTNKPVEQYNWDLIRERIIADNPAYMYDCKNTTKMIVVVEKDFFSNGLRSMFKDNIQLVTLDEYESQTKEENTIHVEDAKWYTKLYRRFFPEQQITTNTFYHKNTNLVPICIIGFALIISALIVTHESTPEPPKVSKEFAQKMNVTKSVTKIDTTDYDMDEPYALNSVKPIKLAPIKPVSAADTIEDVEDTVQNNIAAFIPMDNRSPYQKMLDSLRGERMRSDSLAKFLRETRMIQIVFTAKITDGYSTRSVSSDIIVDSIRSADITNMSIALNDMANNMARERAREIEDKKIKTLIPTENPDKFSFRN